MNGFRHKYFYNFDLRPGELQVQNPQIWWGSQMYPEPVIVKSCDITHELLADLESAPWGTCSVSPGSKAKMPQSAVSISPGTAKLSQGNWMPVATLRRQWHKATPSIWQHSCLPQRGKGFSHQIDRADNHHHKTQYFCMHAFTEYVSQLED